MEHINILKDGKKIKYQNVEVARNEIIKNEKYISTSKIDIYSNGYQIIYETNIVKLNDITLHNYLEEINSLLKQFSKDNFLEYKDIVEFLNIDNLKTYEIKEFKDDWNGDFYNNEKKIMIKYFRKGKNNNDIRKKLQN